jgi:hypothetical protein
MRRILLTLTSLFDIGYQVDWIYFFHLFSNLKVYTLCNNLFYILIFQQVITNLPHLPWQGYVNLFYCSTHITVIQEALLA